MEKIDFLRGVAFFKEIDKEYLLKLADIVKEKKFKKNSIIFLEDEPGEKFYIIKSGAVKILRTSVDGRIKTLSILGEGEYFGEMALIDKGERSATAQAITDVALYIIYKFDFENIIRQFPSIALKIINTLSYRLREADYQIEVLTFQNSCGRIANSLLKLAEQFGETKGNIIKIKISLTHQDIAELSGVSRETTTRWLNKFKEEKILNFTSRKIIILDEKKLKSKLG